MNAIKKIASFFHPGQLIQGQQVRHQFDGWHMLKDFRKRKAVEAHGKERLRLFVMMKNKVLPPELQELAKEELSTYPAYSRVAQLRRRCTLTSRSRGNVTQYRVSRIVFRHLADYNKLAGVLRARW